MVNWGSVHCGSRYTPPGTAGLCYLPSIPGTLNSCCHRHLYHHSASTPRPHSRYRSSFATPHPFCAIPVNAVGMSTNHVLNGPPYIPTPIRLASSLRGRDSRIMLSQISPIFLTLVSMRSTSTITKALTNAGTIPISHSFHLGAPKNDVMVDSLPLFAGLSSCTFVTLSIPRHTACVFKNLNVGFAKMVFVIISKPQEHLFSKTPHRIGVITSPSPTVCLSRFVCHQERKLPGIARFV